MLEERLHCVTAAESEEQWKQMKAILQETTAEVITQSAQYKVHLGSGAATLGWPRHKDRRRTHAKSAILVLQESVTKIG